MANVPWLTLFKLDQFIDETPLGEWREKLSPPDRLAKAVVPKIKRPVTKAVGEIPTIGPALRNAIYQIDRQALPEEEAARYRHQLRHGGGFYAPLVSGYDGGNQPFYSEAELMSQNGPQPIGGGK